MEKKFYVRKITEFGGMVIPSFEGATIQEALENMWRDYNPEYWCCKLSKLVIYTEDYSVYMTIPFNEYVFHEMFDNRPCKFEQMFIELHEQYLADAKKDLELTVEGLCSDRFSDFHSCDEFGCMDKDVFGFIVPDNGIMGDEMIAALGELDLGTDEDHIVVNEIDGIETEMFEIHYLKTYDVNVGYYGSVSVRVKAISEDAAIDDAEYKVDCMPTEEFIKACGFSQYGDIECAIVK